MNEDSCIRWIHLSDLHFNFRKHSNYEKNLLNDLKNYFKKQKTKNQKPDLIIVAGDISAKGRKEDYDLAKEFFKELLNDLDLKKNHIFFVPGNHDVTHGEGPWLFLKRTLIDDKKAMQFFGNTKAKNRRYFLEKFKNYKEFVSEFRSENDFVVGDVVYKPEIINIKDFLIAFISFNSSWFCKDISDYKKLWIGNQTLIDRRKELNELKTKPTLIIGLVHHPKIFLHPEDSAKSNIHNLCHLLMIGHIHEPSVKVGYSESGSDLQITSGSLIPEKQNEHSICFFAKMDLNQRKIKLKELHYDPTSPKKWLTHKTISILLDKILEDPPIIEPLEFPFTNCDDINTRSWRKEIRIWFDKEYSKDPKETIDKLLKYCFKCLNKTYDKGLKSYKNQFKKLGEDLVKKVPKFIDNELNIYWMILELLKLGIDSDYHHFFKDPRIFRHKLIEIPNYTRLLLSAKYFATDRFKQASELVKDWTIDCSFITYITGHSSRKDQDFQRAKPVLEKNIKLLKKFSGHGCDCNKNSNELLCKENLLNAQNSRGLGVLFREIKRFEKGEEHFDRAINAVEREILNLKESQMSNMEINQDNMENNEDYFYPDYNMSTYHVLADVYYSQGYSYYKQKKYNEAKEAFLHSIHALEDGKEEWEAPHIRLGMVYLFLNHLDKSYEQFQIGRDICFKISAEVSREVSLGLPICTLGIMIIGAVNPGLIIAKESPIDALNPSDELESSLREEPNHSITALKGHLYDAKAFTKLKFYERLNGVKQFVLEVIKQLKKEIDRLS
ncbi:MAG: metallophosphoesterase [Promethearchaeota archaeon]